MKVYVYGSYSPLVKRYHGVTCSIQEAFDNYVIAQHDGLGGWIDEYDDLLNTTKELKIWRNYEYEAYVRRAERNVQYTKINDNRPDRV